MSLLEVEVVEVVEVVENTTTRHSAPTLLVLHISNNR